MMNKDLVRNLVDDLRTWRRLTAADPGKRNKATWTAEAAVASSWDVIEEALAPWPAEVNKPTGEPFGITWAEVQSGWFVHHPVTRKDFEVVSSHLRDGRQFVSLRVGDQVAEWPRDPDGSVVVKHGSHVGLVDRDRVVNTLAAHLGQLAVIADGGQFS